MRPVRPVVLSVVVLSVLLLEPLRHAVLTVLRWPFAVVRQTAGVVATLPRLPALREEHDRLRADTLQQQLELARLREVLRQSEASGRIVEAHPAVRGLVGHVIDRSRVPTQQTVLIDRGTRHGLRVDGVVLDADGVAGRILDVHPDTALVLLVTDADSRVAVLIERSRETGLLVGRSQGTCAVRYLDLDADVEEGDRVVTAGLGDAVPKGLPVAVVTRVERDALRGTAQAAAKPTADLGRLEEVLCLLD